jgi:hypothetical protein
MGGAQTHCTQTKRIALPFSHLGKAKEKPQMHVGQRCAAGRGTAV